MYFLGTLISSLRCFRLKPGLNTKAKRTICINDLGKSIKRREKKCNQWSNKLQRAQNSLLRHLLGTRFGLLFLKEQMMSLFSFTAEVFT